MLVPKAREERKREKYCVPNSKQTKTFKTKNKHFVFLAHTACAQSVFSGSSQNTALNSG